MPSLELLSGVGPLCAYSAASALLAISLSGVVLTGSPSLPDGGFGGVHRPSFPELHLRSWSGLHLLVTSPTPFGYAKPDLPYTPLVHFSTTSASKVVAYVSAFAFAVAYFPDSKERSS
ncbi:hypothetical protein PR202_gb00264 [Eleusine coracana subsp. coracana]|uniref:Uncharacterized protein n=1 Tax=Eleusine coracana subsp. coracana TaxID=191504 RepID=A0AAV5DTG5_ELECO|nr:hypothetical protein PR202_gb00264 [Eleusine coracana subsp. coracana]